MISFHAPLVHGWRAVVGCIVAGAAVFAAECRLGASDRPNIIVIMSDDVGYNEFGFTSALNQQPTQFETPRIDALASQSSIITNGYVAAAVCSPSRAGLMTGLYPQRFGYEDNISRGTAGEIDGLSGQETIASHLKDLGYSTGAIGKWHLGVRDNVNRPQDVGFDDFYGFLGGGRAYYQYVNGVQFDPAMRRGDEYIELTWGSEGDPSLYDPLHGRYLTDALAEEAVNYVDQRAGDDNPFFLYVAFTATHTPRQVKQQDYERFAHIADEGQRTMVAMSYSLDRAVGMILDSVESNGLSDNTMIVYVNDNGGQGPHHSNTPYKGHKGSMFEGGIRVPFVIKAPGIEPGTYEQPVTTLDLLPTLVSVAGGEPSQLTTDGVDLLPYLQGESSGDPHEILFWRSHDGRFAVRRGDWKLVSPSGLNPSVRLYNLATDPRENTVYHVQHPEIVAELVHELTLWETQLHKALWGSLGVRNKNYFDHFVYHPEQAASGVWSTSGQWLQEGTTTAVRLTPEDAYANAILEFRTNNAGSYVATNDMLRVTRYTFMANELRFAGTFAAAGNAQATINGNAVLMVKNLAGQLPKLRIDAGRTGAGEFVFQLDNELQLMDDLEITGDGTETLVVSGAIRDYHEPRGVVKTGESHVKLSGNNTFGGMLSVNGGRLTVDGPSAAIRNAARIVIGENAEFELAGGIVSVPVLDNTASGVFSFRSGRFETDHVLGDVTNNGGIFSPGLASDQCTITGNFTQAAGSLQIEIGPASPGGQVTSLLVDGEARLGGRLEVTLDNAVRPFFGQVIPILSATGGIVGDFDQLSLPSFGSGVRFTTLRTDTALSLEFGLSGDYNRDGSVDGGDYVLWRRTISENVPAWTGADGNGDGHIDTLDFAAWKSFYNPLSQSFGPSGDYNRDGRVDGADYVVWRRTYGQSVIAGTGADGNRDGQINELDFNLWKRFYGSVTRIPGDFNLDGNVDSADYVVWRRSYGESVVLGTGADGNIDGRVDELDFALWKSNFGNHASIAIGDTTSAVPEPEAAVLAWLALFFVSMARNGGRVLTT